MRRSPSADRVLATVLFTDIVGSTERAAEVGDRRWRELVARHHQVVRAMLKRFRGREIDTAGDGFFATFDRPARAIECALAIIEALRPLGLVIRAGVHAGELEVSGSKFGGIAVHTAARVVAAAGPGEVLVTATVRELVAGSQIEFEDRGTATLKGVPGEWHLFAVVAPVSATTDTGEGDGAPPVAASRTRARLSRLWAVIGVAAVLALSIIVAAVALPRLFAPPVVPGVDTVARVDASGNAFERAVSVGRRPIGLAVGDGAVWAINFDGRTLTRVATGSNLRDDTAVGGSPTGIAYGEGAVWITTAFGLNSGEAGTVVRFSTNLQRTEDNIPVGNGASAIAYGEGAVWVADLVRDVLLRISPANNAVEREVPVARSPAALAVGAGSVWVGSSLDGVVQRFDPQTYKVEAQIPVETPIAIAVGTDAVWVASELGDEVIRIDTANNALGGRFPVGDGPRGIAVTDDAVWVALGPAGQLVRLDPATGVVETRLDVDGFADAVVVDADGRVWVSVRRP
jgi:class 3 adenylate cyclase/streptogramin lyase